MGDRLRVGMIGPGLDVPGGMTAVHRTWLRSRAFDGVDVDYFETMGEGTFLEKLGKNILGQSRFVRSSPPATDPTSSTSMWRIAAPSTASSPTLRRPS